MAIFRLKDNKLMMFYKHCYIVIQNMSLISLLLLNLVSNYMKFNQKSQISFDY